VGCGDSCSAGGMAGLEAAAPAQDLEVGGWKKCRGRGECIHPKPGPSQLLWRIRLSSDKVENILNE